MDPASALITAVVAGAAAAAQSTTAEAVKGAYAALKALLVKRLSSLPRLEEKPHSTSARQSAIEEAEEKGLAQDAAIALKARAVVDAMESYPADRLPDGIRLDDLRAAGDILVSDNQAPVHAKGLTAGGRIEIARNVSKQ